MHPLCSFFVVPAFFLTATAQVFSEVSLLEKPVVPAVTTTETVTTLSEELSLKAPIPTDDEPSSSLVGPSSSVPSSSPEPSSTSSVSIIPGGVLTCYDNGWCGVVPIEPIEMTDTDTGTSETPRFTAEWSKSTISAATTTTTTSQNEPATPTELRATDSPVSTMQPPMTDSETGDQGSKTNIGAIVGGVVGGLAVLCIAAVAVFYIKRRQPRSAQTQNTRPPPYGYADVPELVQVSKGYPPQGHGPSELVLKG